MEFNKKTLRNIFIGVAGCIVLYWLLHETGRVTSWFKTIVGMLSPFLVGSAIAFVLNVPMRAIERQLKVIKKDGLRRAVALVLTLFAVVLVLTGVVYLLIPQITQTIESLVSKLPAFIDRLIKGGETFLTQNPELLEWISENTDFNSINWSSLAQKAVEFVTNSVYSIADKAFATIISLSTGIFNGVLSFVFALYCLGRKEVLARQGRRILYSVFPERFSDEAIRVLRMTNTAFSNFISGQCLEAVILGAMFAVSMSIFKMPYMPLVSVIIAVTALVPIVGAFAGCVLGAIFILVDNPVLAFWFVIMFLILQQIEGNMIYPRVVGGSIGLPGMWVLVAVVVGGETMGVGGMLIMIPFASVLYALIKEYTEKRLGAKNIDRDKLQDHPPELMSGFKKKRKEKQKRRRLLYLAKKKLEENKEETQEDTQEDNTEE